MNSETLSKAGLLFLLEDTDIQRKILEIVSIQRENSAANPKDASDKISALESELRSVIDENESALNQLQKASEKILALESKLRDVTNEKNSALNQLQSARVEIYQLKADLSKAAQREKNYLAESEELEKSNARLKNSLAELQKKFADFERGWQLFQAYQRVGAHARQILDTGVFLRNNFMAFICGGAQPNSLENIWDVTHECVLSGDTADADILWQIFEYSLELVNSARAQASYSILPVNVGDRFDSDFHAEGPNSRSQGYISAVYLRGFQNDYNRRVIRKSIVRVS